MADQRESSLSTLKGMFPDVDPEVCEAVFDANQADLEQSINALLGISDPNYKIEENIPVQTEVCNFRLYIYTCKFRNLTRFSFFTF